MKTNTTGEGTDLRCLEGPQDCRGEVELRTTSDRQDGKAFPRCAHHYAGRERRAEENRRLDEWGRHADPSYAGEVYDDGDEW